MFDKITVKHAFTFYYMLDVMKTSFQNPYNDGISYICLNEVKIKLKTEECIANPKGKSATLRMR